MFGTLILPHGSLMAFGETCDFEIVEQAREMEPTVNSGK